MDTDVESTKAEVSVDPKWCDSCRFYPNTCQYYDNENAGNITYQIANSDGSCQLFQPKNS